MYVDCIYVTLQNASISFRFLIRTKTNGYILGTKFKNYNRIKKWLENLAKFKNLIRKIRTVIWKTRKELWKIQKVIRKISKVIRKIRKVIWKIPFV